MILDRWPAASRSDGEHLGPSSGHPGPGRRWLGPGVAGAILVLLLIIPFRRMWGAPMFAFGDLAAYPKSAGSFVASFVNSWSTRGLGRPGSSGPAVLFSAGLVTVLGRNARLAQHLELILWAPVGFAGVLYLVRRRFRWDWAVAALAGVLYVATPVAIGLVLAGEVALLWIYALTPAVICAGETLLRSRGRRWAPFALALAGVSFWTPEVLLFGPAVAIVWILVGNDHAKLPVTRGFVIAIALAAVVALPNFAGRYVAPNPELVGKGVADARYTYQTINPETVLRLAGNHGDPMDALGYNRLRLRDVWGFVPLLLLLGGIALAPRNLRPLALRLAALAAGAAVALLLLKVLAERSPFLLERLPAALAFRNPQKLTILLAAAMMAGAALGLGAVRRLPRGPLSPALPVLALLLAVGYLTQYTGPVLSGDWDLGRLRPGTATADATLQSVAASLERRDPSIARSWRVLWIPLSPRDVLNLVWLLPNFADDPVLESASPAAHELGQLLLNSLGSSDLPLFHLIADRLSVRYIVVRNRGPVGRVTGLLATDPQLDEIRGSPGLRIWQNRGALPRVRAFASMAVVRAGNATSSPDLPAGVRDLLKQANPADPGSGWSLYPPRDFHLAAADGQGVVVRVGTRLTRDWPVMSLRVPVQGGLPYRLSAVIRVRDARLAHVKVIWYEHRSDPERAALREDKASPVLSGTQGWTTLSTRGLVSPYLASFADVQLLAGRAAPGSIGQTWLSSLAFGYAPLLAGPASRAALLGSLSADPAIPPGAELMDAVALGTRWSPPAIRPPLIRSVFLNPTPADFDDAGPLIERSVASDVLLEPYSVMSPIAGTWRVAHQGASPALEVVRGPATGRMLVAVPRPGRYRLILVGCELRAVGVRLGASGRVFQSRQLHGPEGCGAASAVQTLPASSSLTLSLNAGARIRSILLSTMQAGRSFGPPDLRVLHAAPTSIRLETPAGAAGITLADGYGAGWRLSSPGGLHLPTLLGLNTFLLPALGRVDGLDYGPQRGRLILLAAEGLAWLLILIALWRQRRLRGDRSESEPLM